MEFNLFAKILVKISEIYLGLKMGAFNVIIMPIFTYMPDIVYGVWSEKRTLYTYVEKSLSVLTEDIFWDTVNCGAGIRECAMT